MGTFLGVIFIVAAAAIGAYVGTRPTVMDGHWIAEKLKPKKYGNKVALTDAEGGPLTVNVIQRAAHRSSE